MSTSYLTKSVQTSLTDLSGLTRGHVTTTRDAFTQDDLHPPSVYPTTSTTSSSCQTEAHLLLKRYPASTSDNAAVIDANVIKIRVPSAAGGDDSSSIPSSYEGGGTNAASVVTPLHPPHDQSHPSMDARYSTHFQKEASTLSLKLDFNHL